MLFDDNIGFMTFDFGKKTQTESKEIVSPEEGFFRGNMFKDEYKPYKNYKYSRVVPSNARDALLLEIMALTFAKDDLNLYLDLHPRDEGMLKKFKAIVEQCTMKEMEFVKKYGPLELVDSDDLQKFKWIDDPWPWQKDGGAKYV